MFSKEKDLEQAKIIFRKLTKENKTYAEIATELNIDKTSAFKCLKRNKSQLKIDGVACLYHWLVYTGEIEEFINLYTSETCTTVSLGKRYNISERTAADYLVRAGVQLRHCGNKVLENKFSNITTETEAYLIGLITANGSINESNDTCTITLTQADKYILEKISKELFNNKYLVYLTHKNEPKPRANLRFYGVETMKNLNKHNIKHRKTYNLKEMSSLIPKELYHHYIRGLYDGNGVCSKSGNKIRIGYCSHLIEFTTNYRNFLNKKLNLPLNKLFNTGGCWQVSWSAKQDLTNFYNYIYKDAHIFLGRKRTKLYNYIANTEITK